MPVKKWHLLIYAQEQFKIVFLDQLAVLCCINILKLLNIFPSCGVLWSIKVLVQIQTQAEQQ